MQVELKAASSESNSKTVTLKDGGTMVGASSLSSTTFIDKAVNALPAGKVAAREDYL